MLNRRILLLACLAIGLFTPALATAGMRPWLSGAFGGSTYKMGDVNEDIGAINMALAGSGLQMDEINSGLNYGLAFGLDFGSGFHIGLGYDRLNGRSEVSDPTGGIEYDLPANLLRGFGRFSFESTGKTKGFLEVSLGQVSSEGSVTISEIGVGAQSVDLEGSGLAIEGAGGFSYWTSPSIALVGSVGYRSADVEDIEALGQPVFDASGGRYSIDYSGVFLRLGMTVALAP